MNDDAGGLLDRVAGQVGGMDVVERLATLSGSDFASLMMEVVRRRAARQTPADVLRRYERDRFVRPGGIPWRSTRSVEDTLLGCLPREVEMVTLAPLVPLGTHSALASVSQNKVVTAVRACEVAADPTNALALEAAVRRASQARATVQLAAIQRVTRAQRFAGDQPAHFSLLALVTAGRDEGSRRFELAALTAQLRFAVTGLSAVGLPAQVALTPLSPGGEQTADAVAAELAGQAEVVTDRERTSGREYYGHLCFKVNVLANGGPTEVGDGGFTDWTAKLLASGKERLLISGYGLDRLAGVVDGQRLVVAGLGQRVLRLGSRVSGRVDDGLDEPGVLRGGTAGEGEASADVAVG